MKEIYSPYTEKLRKQEKEGKINSLKKVGAYLLLTAGIVGGGMMIADSKDGVFDVMSKAKSVAYESLASSMEIEPTVISPENLVDSSIYTIDTGETLNAVSWQELDKLSEKNNIDADQEFNGSEVNLKINQAQQKSADQNGNIHPGDSFKMQIGRADGGYDLSIEPLK